MDVERVGRVGEDGEEVRENDNGGTDEEDPLEGRGRGHVWQEVVQFEVGSHLRLQHT